MVEYQDLSVVAGPIDGDIMIFGGKVRHAVYPNESTANRITVAVNFKVQ